MLRGRTAWCLPHNSNKTGTWKMNAAPKRIVDGVLDSPKKAEIFAKELVGRSNQLPKRRGGFAEDSGASLRLPAREP